MGWIALILVALIIFFINCNVGLTNTTTLSISSGNNLDSLFICSMSKCRFTFGIVYKSHHVYIEWSNA